MTRRVFGCCLGVVTLGALLLVLVATYPYIEPQVPRIATLVNRGVRAIEHQVAGPKPSPTPSQGWRLHSWVQPSPSPSAVSTVYIGPSAADCQWGEATLAQDQSLDLQSASRYLSSSAWYHETAGWWATARSDLLSLCGGRTGAAGSTGGWGPTLAACQADYQHFATALQLHVGAEATDTPANLAWDRTWAENYQRLEGIWAATGCGGAGN